MRWPVAGCTKASKAACSAILPVVRGSVAGSPYTASPITGWPR
jgi:hypothetical protein